MCAVLAFCYAYGCPRWDERAYRPAPELVQRMAVQLRMHFYHALIPSCCVNASSYRRNIFFPTEQDLFSLVGSL